MNNNFNNMDDLFNQLMGNMGGFRSESRRYMINGREVTPEEFAIYRQTGQLPNEESEQVQHHQGKGMKQDGILAKLGRNLTEEAREGKLDPVIGRNKEIQETSEILSRRTKNNPVLVGDAGVGKTAVVEGLAQAIVNGDVPAAIKNKEIISIDISGLEAGTQYRGSFEENIQNLVNEVKEAGNIILFFDEIHQILGAGSTGDGQGSKGLADILKPALSRGELTVIGATTQDEYRNTILKNAALARRFNEVKVNAPSAEDTFKILQGIRELYQQHHNVVLPDEVLKAAVDYSVQYIPQRSLPDKAIDLVDVTAAHLAAQHPVTDVHAVEHEIEEEKAKQEAAAAKEDYEAALNAKIRIEELEKQIANHTEDHKVTATVNDVAESVERMTGIPVSQMGATDIERLKDMGHRLQTKVIGQDKAVEAVAKAIRRNRAGFDEGNRPIGSFLFVGPTGVGKTELSKQLAIELFGSADSMIRFDMSEYMEKHAVAKLVGAPPGYVGYDEAGQLTEKVRRNPYSLILLDEVEKAHPDVLHMFLQVLDDGRLTDGQGRTVSFKDTIIIMTSNAGTGKVEASVGFGAARENRTNSVLNQLGDFFSPEFMNRFDGIIEFSALSKENLLTIVDLMLDNVNQRLANNGIHLSVTEKVKEKLVDLGYDPKMGARPLRRTIQDHIEDAITDFYLENPNEKDLKAVMTSKGHITIKSAKKAEKTAQKAETAKETD